MALTLVLGLFVGVAFTVEAALGFGATVVAVSLGAFLLPIDELLRAFVPLNVALSTTLVARHWRLVDQRTLLVTVLPAMALGLPVGFFALALAPESVARVALGAFIVWLAALELWRHRSAAGVTTTALPRRRQQGLLWLGGVVHGAFATGGPLVVYVLGRTLSDKGAFRATLSALWLVLNTLLLLGFAARGALDGESATRSLTWAPFLLGGLLLGERLHRSVPAALFRRLVFVVLLVAGALLVLRA